MALEVELVKGGKGLLLRKRQRALVEWGDWTALWPMTVGAIAAIEFVPRGENAEESYYRANLVWREHISRARHRPFPIRNDLEECCVAVTCVSGGHTEIRESNGKGMGSETIATTVQSMARGTQ
jgi:hypothetical protein